MLSILLFVMSMWVAQSPHDRADQPAAAMLLPGLGHLHHPIATTSPEAQQFFDQGLTLVYGFNHDEAIKAFRRAAGSWRGKVDAEELIRNIYADRLISTRPKPEL